ncbi:MAG TPA: hypothetical protein VG602_10050, partial [Actinomycetota bacterium]|nr:hypothetical protein [Actinomycetota bacterium]
MTQGEGETTLADGDATVGEVLRWLLDETDADAGIYLRLTPGGDERLIIEPRGLSDADLSFLVRQARHAIVEGEVEPEVNDPVAQARWMSRAGSKILLLRGTSQSESEDALRFARFVIEWLSAPRGEEAPNLEQQLRKVPGVAWAELSPGDPPSVRVLLDPGVEPGATRMAISRAVGRAGVEVDEVESPAPLDPRVRLVDLNVDVGEGSLVDVLLDWKGQSLRGRGRGRATAAGRSYASAQAVADAMKPLLDVDIEVEGLYRTNAPDDEDVLVVTVRVGPQRYVGAVVA